MKKFKYLSNDGQIGWLEVPSSMQGHIPEMSILLSNALNHEPTVFIYQGVSDFVQYTEENWTYIQNMFGARYQERPTFLTVLTPEGEKPCNIGDWIVRNEKGEYDVLCS